MKSCALYNNILHETEFLIFKKSFVQFSPNIKLLNFRFLNELSFPHLLIRVRLLLLHVRYEVLLIAGEGYGDHHYQEDYHRHHHYQGENEEQDDTCRISGVLKWECFS